MLTLRYLLGVRPEYDIYETAEECRVVRPGTIIHGIYPELRQIDVEWPCSDEEYEQTMRKIERAREIKLQ